ncbi:hypothetical protein GCM10009549_45040 [Streptomyces thermoalcalitolerans]|uniref:Pentapeptide repeat-containing protein n=2 Tax=Streptomyces thermoalcalitolerans TaxID=65605 RepID=A0ABP3ZMF1_9ACTN
MDNAVLVNAVLDGAELVKASLCDADGSGASFRGTKFVDTFLINTNFRNADLRNAVFEENSFKVTLDEETKLEGASGTVFGPAVVVEGQASRELSGDALEQWIRSRGGNLRVLTPRGA